MRYAIHIAVLFFAAAFACSGESAHAQRETSLISPELQTRVDAIAEKVLAKTGVPSASVAVVQHGAIIYTHAYGNARLASGSTPAIPATPQMRYAIGSVSKQFTAAAILLLQQQGKLSLDDAVGKYIPGLTRGNEVTIREILSQTSGYQDYWPEDYLMTPMLKPVTAEQILDTWAKKPLDFEPGTQWQYSNTNYVIAGRVVEIVSGEPIFEFIAKNIFHPLGMTSVWNDDEAKLTQADATPYIRYALGPLRPAPLEGHGWMFAAFELAMTAHDLALWDKSLLDQSILSPATYKAMYTDVKLKNGEGTHYGLGVFVRDIAGHRSIEHGGETSGFVSDNVVLVDDGAAVVVLTNQDAVSAASQIANQVAPLLLNATAEKLTTVEEQALAIYRGLQKGQIDRALLAPNLNDYFSPQAIADFQSSLGPLGEPLSLHQTHEELRGGMTYRSFEIQYPDRTLELSTFTYPDGKLEQYLVAPAE